MFRGTRVQGNGFGVMPGLRYLSSASPSSSSSRQSHHHHHYPIVIVGGGPCGLFLANLLQRFANDDSSTGSTTSRHKHPSWCLLDAQRPEDHWIHPQAHFLNTRTMEILKRFFPTTIYSQVQKAMPPVSEWNTFSFGTSMFLPSSEVGKQQQQKQPMATVQHPVHIPLAAGADANGILLEQPHDVNDNTKVSFPADDPNAILLSDCTVGHLGQHIFHKILYQHLVEAMTPHTVPSDTGEAREEYRDEETNTNTDTPPLFFGSKVTNAIYDKERGIWTITTENGHIVTTPLVVACDGARSTWRERYLGIPMTGQPVIQRLINVHFSLSQPSSSSSVSSSSIPEQPRRVLPPAMLYTIFSPKVLAMVVRHSPTDYVMQIPFFPPYQIVEEDFSTTQVTEMVRAALFGGHSEDQQDIDESVRFHIHSIRPWTMGSLVAESYAKDNAFLVGDAAHVFPPAGGFGMNTGLQDALALAWRLHYHLSAEEKNRSTSSTTIRLHLPNIPHAYTQERRVVAYQNAALSVRNYNRVLGVMKSCYLDERNLPLLLSSLETSDKLGLPLPWQQATFRRLFQTALLPLSMLKDRPSSPYSRRVKHNLRKLLLSGQGLPLLFPRNELGFSYPTLQSESSHGPSSSSSYELQADWETDSTAPPKPLLKADRLMPHIPCRQIHVHAPMKGTTMESLNSSATATPSSLISTHAGSRVTTTRDLSVQLASPSKPWPFVLLRLVDCDKTTYRHEQQQERWPINPHDVEQRLGGLVHVVFAELLIGRPNEEIDVLDNQDSFTRTTYPNVAVLVASRSHWDQLSFGDASRSGSGPETEQPTMMTPDWVILRPDGHVTWTCSNDFSREALIEDIAQTIFHACGFSEHLSPRGQKPLMQVK